ncbi:MAG: GspH/FimT family pseudopilin [Gammaproteobacteria bacterium]
MQRTTGFTLLELLGTLAVAGILMALAVPSFRSIVLDSRRTADVNAFVLAVQVARSEAAKRSHSVILCKTLDWRRCGGAELRFDAGWMVFANVDGLLPPERSPEEPLIYAHSPELDGSIVGNRPFFEFRPLLRRSTNGTVVFCDRRGTPAARAVIVSYTGRPRVDQVDPDGKPLVCASLS